MLLWEGRVRGRQVEPGQAGQQGQARSRAARAHAPTCTRTNLHTSAVDEEHECHKEGDEEVAHACEEHQDGDDH